MPFADVLLPRVQAGVLNTSRVVIKQELFKHDLATFDLVDPTAGRRIKLDTPVSITWGFGKDSDTFLGYVQSVKPNVTRGQITVTVTCVGASYALKNKRQKVHRGSRALIVQNVARVAKLTAAAEPTAGAITTNQAGKSDWEFLIQLAKEAGRVLYCHGVQINFVSKDFWLERQGRNAPVLWHGGPSNEAGTLLGFEPRLANSDEENPRGKFVIYYYDAAAKKVFAVTGNGQSKAPSRKDTGKTKFTAAMSERASSLAEAEDRVRAKEELARFVHKAAVRCNGNARIHQGRPVYLYGVPEDTGGYWMVHTATHTITGGKYTCDLVVDTDSLGQENRPPPMETPVVPAVEDVIDAGFSEGADPTGDDVIATGIDADAALDAALERLDESFVFDPEGEDPAFGDEKLLEEVERELEEPGEEIPIPDVQADDETWAALPRIIRDDELLIGTPLVETVPEGDFSPGADETGSPDGLGEGGDFPDSDGDGIPDEDEGRVPEDDTPSDDAPTDDGTVLDPDDPLLDTDNDGVPDIEDAAPDDPAVT